MNPHGHGKIADDVGLPLLVSAFKARGYERVPLNAFPLGNWLTDVQQFVDPVTITAPVWKERVRSGVEEIVNSVFLTPRRGEDRLSRWIRQYQGKVERVVRQKQQELNDSIDVIFAPTAPGDPRRTKYADGVRTAFRVNGYFQFVHPVAGVPRLDHEPASGYRLDPDIYFGIFDQMFTQYWPHDHLDRPPVLPPPDPPDFRSEIATGPRAQSGSSFNPDLYAYLREDIEITAGRLARIELEFGVPMFDLRRPPRPADLDWNLSLAMLGRAMHAPEDFFAHSLFSEFCISMLGKEFLPKSTTAQEIIGLRHQRWQREVPNRPPPAPLSEPTLVTGWFDGTDTFFSIVRGLESLFGVRFKDPQLRLAAARDAIAKAGQRPDLLAFDLQQLMYEASETLADPERAMQDRDNRFAQKARELLPATGLGQPLDAETIRRLVADSPVYRDVPDEVKADIVNALVELHGVYKIGKSAISAYKAIRNVVRFFSGPIPTVIGWLGEAIGDEIKGAIWFYIADRVAALTGARRVGSHTLMSKDYEDSVLYDPSWQLAAGVHWYVLSVLTRQHPAMDPEKKAREAEQEDDKDKKEKPAKPARPKATKPRHVDWFDLLEFFLRHPASGGQNMVARAVETCVPIVHVVDNRRRIDSLATLAVRYRDSSCHPESFNWRAIANANFKTAALTDRETQRVVNHVLATSKTGYVVRDGINYAFNPDLPVIIPDQLRTVPSWELEADRTVWWREVIQRGTWKVFSGYDDPERRESVAPLEIGYEPAIIGAGKAALRIKSAEDLRAKREDAYR